MFLAEIEYSTFAAAGIHHELIPHPGSVPLGKDEFKDCYHKCSCRKIRGNFLEFNVSNRIQEICPVLIEVFGNKIFLAD